MVRAGTAAAPLRCRFRLAQSSGCAWCVYRRNHRPRLLVSATPNPTCDRFAGHGGTDRGPHYPVTASLCFLSGWARIVAALKANPKPAQVARAIGGLHHTTVWQIVRAEGIRLAHPRRRRHAHTDSQGVDPPNLAQASPATIPNSRRGERMRSCRPDCARARSRPLRGIPELRDSRENRSLAILNIQCKKTANITGRNSGARIDFAGSDRRTIEPRRFQA